MIKGICRNLWDLLSDEEEKSKIKNKPSGESDMISQAFVI